MAAAPAYKAPPPPVFTWTGFYGGIHAGGGWGTKHWYNQFTGVPGLAGLDVGSHHVRGGLAGGQVGFNYQVGYWVLGVEAQGSWAELTGDNTNLVFVLGPSNIINNSKVTSLASVGGRVGYAFDRVLPYVTGGAAWAHDKYSTTTVASSTPFATGSDNRTGWVAGVGVEYAFWNNLSLKLEYNYYDFGRDRVALSCPTVCGAAGRFDQDIVQQINTVKLGLNYRFGGYGPVYAAY
jgi:outer membrane immunogenic protein